MNSSIGFFTKHKISGPGWTMFIERDAKILLIYYSIFGIVSFISLHIGLLFLQRGNPADQFSTIQLLIFSILGILILILICTIISLKKEISRQEEYLLNLQKSATQTGTSPVQIPYNKEGLYVTIGVCVLCLVLSAYMYHLMVFQQSDRVYIPDNALAVIHVAMLSIILFLTIVLVVSVVVLMRRIRTPLYYEMKPCPRCGSADIHKVEYSWWGGLLGSALVHQVRCKKCGKTYDGSSGKDFTKKMTLYYFIVIVITLILIILRFIL